MRELLIRPLALMLLVGGIGGPAMAVAAMADSGDGRPWERDFGLTSPRIHFYATGLGSQHPGESHEAAQRLAWSGILGMTVVDSLVEAGSLRDTTAIRAYLSLALLASVSPSELEAFPRLQGMAQAEIESGLEIESPVGPYHSDKHLFRQGFAVPGAVVLCKDPRSKYRGRGVKILRELNAVSQIDLLRSMRADHGTYGLSHGDYSSTEVVGNDAAAAAARLESDVTGRFRYELLVPHVQQFEDGGDHSALVNGLRAYGHTLSQTEWDDWWNAARPVWNAWWEVCGEAPTHANIEAWWRKIGRLAPPD